MTGTAEHVLTADYLGCYGRVHFDAITGLPAFATAPFGERPVIPETAALAVQWVRPGAPAKLIRLAQAECLLLFGPVTGPVTGAWAGRIAAALKDGRYAELARIPGELSGCLVTAGQVFLFRSVADSMEGLLYRRDGALLRWSTDPADLLDEGATEFGLDAIWRCCRGHNLFIYRNITPLRPGQLVIADEKATRTVQFDRITPMDLPRRTSLTEYAELAHDLILRSARAFAGCGRVGIMLSGGLDSVTTLTTLVEAGADVVAYHQVSRQVELGEYRYAKAVCDHLDVPLVPIELDIGAGYLSHDWSFPLPYAHLGFRGIEQIADRARDDGVTLMTWGRDGDLIFGPTHYGMHTILTGDISWREKAALCRGLICTGWTLPSLIKSVRRSYSLLTEELPRGEYAPPVDFLAPRPGIPEEATDIGSVEYIAQEHAMNLSLWWPRGIQLCNPLGAKEIQRMAARMPHAYRMLPYQGRLITKPVLRLILSSRLPPEVWRRYGRGWFEMPHKAYVMAHADQIAALIGRPESYLVRLGVVEPSALATVVAEPRERQRHTATLICAAMTELFLRSYYECGTRKMPTGVSTPTEGDRNATIATR